MRFRSTWLALLMGVAVGIALTFSATTFSQNLGDAWLRPRPTAVPGAPAQSTSWTPQIAFQYYGTDTDHDADPAFLAQHVSWLMMRYGAEQTRAKIQAAGYKYVLPQYMLMFQISGPGPYKNSQKSCKNNYTPLSNNVLWTRDFCKGVHPNEDWFLHNAKGERLYMREKVWNGNHNYEYFMNPASVGFRQYWIEQVRKQHDADWQSFFLDNVAATYGYISQRADNGDGTVAEYQNDDAWQDAIVGMLREIRTAFPGYQVWGNIIESPDTADAWNRIRPELDGMQEENFATNWLGSPPLGAEAWEAMIERAEQTLADGRNVVLYGQGEQNDLARMRFSLASYLLVATPDNRATFRYAQTSEYEKLWWYPEYELHFGEPAGPRYRDGDVWVRNFACARVAVDPAKQTGTIELLSCSS